MRTPSCGPCGKKKKEMHHCYCRKTRLLTNHWWHFLTTAGRKTIYSVLSIVSFVKWCYDAIFIHKWAKQNYLENLSDSEDCWYCSLLVSGTSKSSTASECDLSFAPCSGFSGRWWISPSAPPSEICRLSEVEHSSCMQNTLRNTRILSRSVVIKVQSKYTIKRKMGFTRSYERILIQAPIHDFSQWY